MYFEAYVHGNNFRKYYQARCKGLNGILNVEHLNVGLVM